MRYQIGLLLLAFALLIGGCSTTPKQQAAPNQTAQGNGAPQPPPGDGEPVPTSIVESRDNSVITTIRDNYGVISETRVFRDHNLLDNVVVRTIGDGTKFGYAITKDGDKKPLTDTQIAVALTLGAEDLVNSLGINVVAEQPVSQPRQTTEPLPVVTTTALLEPAGASAAEIMQEEDPALAKRRQEEIKRIQEEVRRIQEEKLRRLQRDLAGVPIPRRR